MSLSIGQVNSAGNGSILSVASLRPAADTIKNGANGLLEVTNNYVQDIRHTPINLVHQFIPVGKLVGHEKALRNLKWDQFEVKQFFKFAEKRAAEIEKLPPGERRQQESQLLETQL